MNIWAHRGCSGRFPENTITSFRNALQYDITGIELDIQLSKDGKIVVIHDETVDRTTSGEGSVCDMTAEELRSLEIASPDGTPERIPFIEEVFDLMEGPCRERGLMINIELKNSKVRYEGMEEMILKTVKDHGLQDHVIYSTFCADSVKLMKELDPTVHIGILDAQASECLRLMEETGADAIHPLVHWIDVWDLKNKVCVPVRAWNLAGSEPLYPSEDEIETVDIEKAKEQGITDLITTYPELYAQPLAKADPLDEILFFEKVMPKRTSGRMKSTKTYLISNREPARVPGGTAVGVCDPDIYEYRLYIYDDETDPDLIYSYAYDKESNWTTFRCEATEGEWRSEPTEIDEDCFVRITVRRKDRKRIEGSFPAPADGIVSVSGPGYGSGCGFGSVKRPLPGYIFDEAKSVSERLKAVRKPGDTVLFVLADTHYATNGNWEDTAASLKAAASKCYPDAIVHLGDMTDGLLPRPLTRQFAGRIIRDMERACCEVYCCVGNHDTNYFKKNPDVMDSRECALIYTKGDSSDYYVNIPGRGIRLIFLESFDPLETERNKRYGFSRRTVWKAVRMLKKLPESESAIVISHSPVYGWMHYWSDEIKNGDRLIKKIEKLIRRGKDVMCVMHGHNHADYICNDGPLPVVSIGCSKLEACKEKKPGGAVTPDRERGTRSQELWDIMRISADRSEIDFIRFGAGSDRHLRRRNGVWEYDQDIGDNTGI